MKNLVFRPLSGNHLENVILWRSQQPESHQVFRPLSGNHLEN